MSERLQIEGKLQVNLIPASSTVIHSDQAKPTVLRGGKVPRTLCSLVQMQESQEVEAMGPLLVD